MTTKQKKEATTLEVTVDWDPAYELLVSFLVFVWRGKHVLVELGQTWVDDVKQRLPSDFAQQVSHARGGFKSQHEDDLLGLLVRTCPIERDAATWVDWLAQLSPGDAYELLVPVLPESGPKLPRDFVGWRDRTAALLRTWNSAYFSGLDPQILD